MIGLCTVEKAIYSYINQFYLKKSSFFISVFLLVSVVSNSQDRCGTVEYNEQLKRVGIIKESKEDFEKWIKPKLPVRSKMDREKRLQANSYTVQVVVHIIHNGEPEGTGINLSEQQVKSQINVLNKDFNRENNDAIDTPTEFQSVAGASPIRFELARIDPLGMPTNGINRVQGFQPDFTIEDDLALKSLSYWPAENYLNIWVCHLTDRYGYTQFPVSTLPGLGSAPKSRLTDGIVISFEVFGSTDYGNFLLHPSFNKGRTTTHEMGHFFGLRHLWGDAENCMGDDYVADTPPQSSLTLGCPPQPIKECPLDDPQNKMFQNFLDYTDDECMNLFTNNQVERMMVVLENSPRRASLLLPLSPTQPEVQFPKIFSPNGDGVNDFWLWTNTLDYAGCRLTIFNRFGKAVYEMLSYDNTWNGRTNTGQLLEEEAYYYVISCDNKNEITGAVRIVR